MNCQIEFANDNVGMPCGKPAVAKCADCGTAICSDCSTECCGDPLGQDCKKEEAIDGSHEMS